MYIFESNHYINQIFIEWWGKDIFPSIKGNPISILCDKNIFDIIFKKVIIFIPTIEKR